MGGGPGGRNAANDGRDAINTDTVVEKISLTKCRRRSSICSRITIVTTFMLLFVISK